MTPTASSPSGNEPCVLTQSQPIGMSHRGSRRPSTASRLSPRNSSPRSSGRSDHVPVATASAKAAIAARASTERAGTVRRQMIIDSTSVTAPVNSCRALQPPTRSSTPYHADASQLCTTHGVPGAVNEYGSRRGMP